MLLVRILSALIGIPIVLGSVYLGGLWYSFFLLLVANIGIYEYHVMHKQANPANIFFSFLGVSLFIVITMLEETELLLPLIVLILFALFVVALFNMERASVVDAAVSFWGIIYLGALLSYMLKLRLLPDGAYYTYVLLAGVWIHDTLAYLIGTRWGRHKFAPLISPKKSVQGSLAGMIGTILIFLALALFYPGLIALDQWEAVFLALGISVFAQLGDLLESALKRQLKVKDSGAIIPGHGGILDRFDSLLLVAPFVYYFFIYVNML